MFFSHRSFIRDWPTAHQISSDVRGTRRLLTPSGVAGWFILSSCVYIGSSSVLMLVEVHSRLFTSLSWVCSSFSSFAPVSQDAIQSVHYDMSASFHHRVYPVTESINSLLLMTPTLLQIISQSFFSFSASRVIRDQFLANCSSFLSFKRFSLLLTSCFLRFISSRGLSLSIWTAPYSSLSYWHLFILLPHIFHNPRPGLFHWCSAILQWSQ